MCPDLANAACLSRVEEHSLRCGRLAGVNVRHDANVADTRLILWRSRGRGQSYVFIQSSSGSDVARQPRRGHCEERSHAGSHFYLNQIVYH
jgi:hypothetical protein